ncbi:hypothetical protein [Agromyces sp. NPDC057865]|uniref:hypothetical protein n=1 Tax=Agromyces sp. NPDC057865 TaxID=3346267 RepID=UPI00366C6892
MASAPQPQQEPTEVDSTPAEGSRRRRIQGIALIVVGGLVFLISGIVLLSSAGGDGESSDGAPIEAPAPPDETTYFDVDPDEGAAPLLPAEPQGAKGAPAAPMVPGDVMLADAVAELSVIAAALDEEPTFSDQVVASLSDAAEMVTDSLDEAIDQGATEVIRLLEQADETLDNVRAAADSGSSAAGSDSDVRAAATLVAAAGGLWPEPPTPEPSPTPAPSPDASSIELDDYLAMAGAVGGLLTAAAGVITAVSEWRRTRRARADTRTTARRSGAPSPSGDLDETIRPS